MTWSTTDDLGCVAQIIWVIVTNGTILEDEDMVTEILTGYRDGMPCNMDQNYHSRSWPSEEGDMHD